VFEKAFSTWVFRITGRFLRDRKEIFTSSSSWNPIKPWRTSLDTFFFLLRFLVLIKKKEKEERKEKRNNDLQRHPWYARSMRSPIFSASSIFLNAVQPFSFFYRWKRTLLCRLRSATINADTSERNKESDSISRLHEAIECRKQKFPPHPIAIW